MRKIEPNYDKIIDELLKIDTGMIVDLLVSIYSEKAIEADFKEFASTFNYNVRENVKVLSLVSEVITHKGKNYKDLLQKIIKRNNNYINNGGYCNSDKEMLITEMSGEAVPGMHGYGLSPDMMILYYYSKNIFNNEIIDISKEIMKNKLEIMKKYAGKYIENRVELEGKLKNSMTEQELNEFIYEKSIINFQQDWNKLAEQFSCEYNEETERFDDVRRGIIAFIATKLDLLNEDRASTTALYTALSKQLVLVNRFGEKQAEFMSEFFRMKKDEKESERKIKLLKKEISGLSVVTKSSKKSLEVPDSEKIKKENYYLKTRIEKLEEYIAELEEEKRINEEIADDIVIEEKIIDFRKEAPEYQSIVILGGKWNSKSREEVEDYLKDNDITFIEADKTIRNSDKIRNSDIVIFDTSLNAHKYYYKVRDIADKLYMINKSTKENIEKIFN